MSRVPAPPRISLTVFFLSFLILFCFAFWCGSWRTGSEIQWDNHFLMHFTSLWHYLCRYCVLSLSCTPTVPPPTPTPRPSLCLTAGDSSRRPTSTWRRATLRGWWPMRTFQSSPYQVRRRKNWNLRQCSNKWCHSFESRRRPVVRAPCWWC